MIVEILIILDQMLINRLKNGEDFFPLMIPKESFRSHHWLPFGGDAKGIWLSPHFCSLAAVSASGSIVSEDIEPVRIGSEITSSYVFLIDQGHQLFLSGSERIERLSVCKFDAGLVPVIALIVDVVHDVQN